MHFEVLVEDQSGKAMLNLLIPKIVGAEHTFAVHSYKGIGRIPKNLNHSADPARRILLDRLPKLLAGYGRTFADYPADYPAAVILVCDLDDRCLKSFREELIQILEHCTPRPQTRFCIAVEEGEAWLLGDIQAIKRAYPTAKDNVLNAYVPDSICGTWELLADAISKGGSAVLASMGWQEIGKEKSAWAVSISPHMDVHTNRSPSFRYFRKKLKELVVQQ